MKAAFKKITMKLVTMSLALTVAMSASSALLPQPVMAYSKNIQKGIDIITTANWYLGVRYQYGAPTNIEYAFDCSSFTKYVFGRNYMYLPRNTADQAKMGYEVSGYHLKKGDLLFYSTNSSHGKIAHVAIYSENGWMVHTYGSGGVKYTNIGDPYWKSHFIKARRIFG